MIFLKNLQNQKNQSKKEKVLNAFESGMFLKGKQRKRLARISDCIAKVSDRKFFSHKQLKILTSKQMPERLSIALAQIKAGNTSEDLLNEIRQIIYSLYQKKEITDKVYDTIMNLIKL